MLFALGLGAGLLRAPEILPLPWELGGLGALAPYAVGLALLAALYALALLQSLGRLATLRRVSS
jgi:hypothetical protein